MDKLSMHTANLADENFRKLAELFPNAVTEKKDPATGEIVRAIDVDVLRQEISGWVVEGREERYQFTWPDKKKAMLAANAPIAATLRPVKEESVGKDGRPGGWDSQNLYIEGDNLDVLKLLQETYLGKIKMIYIDPPYNTGNDFVYEDDFAEDAGEYLARSGQYDDQGNRLEQNTESNGRFHTDWLNMMYSRLKLAKNLLASDGVIFISINDKEQASLRRMCDEIFGESNFVATIIRRVMEGGKSDSKGLAIEHEYCHVYIRENIDGVYQKQAEHQDHYNKKDQYFSTRGYYYLKPLENGGLGYIASLDYPIKGPDDADIYPGGAYGDNGYRWVWGKEKFSRALEMDMIEFTPSQKDKSKYKVYYKIYEKVDTDGNPSVKSLPFGTFYLEGYTNRQGVNDLKRLFDDERVFSYPKPVSFLKILCQMATRDDSIVLDFFSGSATMAHAVMQMNSEDGGNRRFIMTQLREITDEKSEPNKAGYENICEIGKERIRRAGRKIKEEAGITAADLDVGFRVLRLDSSNMEDVYYNPEELSRDLLGRTVDNIKIDRSGEDLLFQVMLDLGVDLSSTIEDRIIGGKKVYVVKPAGIDKEYLVACFDKGVSEDVVTEIAKMQPYYAVFRDNGMASDSVATNFDQIFETYSSQTVRKVL